MPGSRVQALHMIEYPDLHLTVSIGGVYGTCTLDPGIRQADKLLLIPNLLLSRN